MPPSPSIYYHDRSSSMSRVSSSDPREYQVYAFQQRPWQSSPDLRMEKWKPSATNNTNMAAPSAQDSLDVVDFIKDKKQQFLAQLLKEKAVEEESFK